MPGLRSSFSGHIYAVSPFTPSVKSDLELITVNATQCPDFNARSKGGQIQKYNLLHTNYNKGWQWGKGTFAFLYSLSCIFNLALGQIKCILSPGTSFMVGLTPVIKCIIEVTVTKAKCVLLGFFFVFCFSSEDKDESGVQKAKTFYLSLETTAISYFSCSFTIELNGICSLLVHTPSGLTTIIPYLTSAAWTV